MCFHMTAINENVSRVYLYDILVCFAMYLMRPTCISLLLLYTKLARYDFESERRDSLLYPAFSLKIENRAVKCPGHPFLNFLDPPLKRQSRCSKDVFPRCASPTFLALNLMKFGFS